MRFVIIFNKVVCMCVCMHVCMYFRSRDSISTNEGARYVAADDITICKCSVTGKQTLLIDIREHVV